MKPSSEFDCVQMKWDIQQALLEEERQFGVEEARRRREERLRNHPVLGPYLQRLEEYRKANEQHPSVA